MAAISTYLAGIYSESVRRGYDFDALKISCGRIRGKITVTSGQLEFELDHLKRKLWKRDRRLYRLLEEVEHPKAHPLFVVKAGSVEDWEAV